MIKNNIQFLFFIFPIKKRLSEAKQFDKIYQKCNFMINDIQFQSYNFYFIMFKIFFHSNDYKEIIFRRNDVQGYHREKFNPEKISKDAIA